MELRIRDGHAVLDNYQICGQESPKHNEPSEKLLDDKQLIEELTEWAQVVAAVQHCHSGNDAARRSPETHRIIGERGKQLASRVANATSRSIDFIDPITDVSTVIHPRDFGNKTIVAKHNLRWRSPNEPVPWATGLTVSVFAASVVAIALLALATLLAKEMPDWISLVITCLFGIGISPSLWLARAIPVIRWLALGAFVGLIIAVGGAFGIALR